MNNKLVIFGVFLGGLSGGFAAGYFFAKKKAEAEAEKEVAEMREYYRKRQKDDKNSDDISSSPVETSANYATEIDTFRKTYDPSDNLKEDKKETLMPKVDIQEVEVKERDIPVIPRRNLEGVIEAITQEQYDCNTDGFEKDLITYYIYNDVCTDSSGDVLANPQQYIGNLYLSGSRERAIVDGEARYVRNYDLETDYEVIFETAQFLEGVDSD